MHSRALPCSVPSLLQGCCKLQVFHLVQYLLTVVCKHLPHCSKNEAPAYSKDQTRLNTRLQIGTCFLLTIMAITTASSHAMLRC